MRVGYMYIADFRNVPVQNVNKVIIQETFNDLLEHMIETSHKYRAEIAIGDFIAKLHGVDI